MRCFYAFLLCVSIANGFDLTSAKYKQHWQEWKSFYGKTYESEAQDVARYAVWKNNLQVRYIHNVEMGRGNPIRGCYYI